MPTARFTTASAILCSAIIVASPVLAADFTWDGNGDPNNGGNWSDPLNWDVGAGYPDDTNDTANLPAPSLVRLITVDVPTTNDTLHVVADSANSRLRLDADLHLDTFDGSGSGWLTKLDLNGFTLSVNKANTAYLPELDGAGHLLKVGAGTATLQAENNFTGSMTISNGTVFFRCGDYTTASKLSVLDGGTAEIGGVCAIAPSVVEINGPGFSGLGALEFTGNPQTFASAVTVATDAKIRRAAGSTMMTGDILGSGILTLEGPGILDFTATGITYTNKLIVTGGTTRISGDFPDLKHILVDAGGVLEGLHVQFSNAVVVTQNGGVWLQNANATWSGNGDGSNWTDTANWSPNIVPTNTATVPAAVSPAMIVVDAPATLDALIMFDNANNDIRINHEMSIGFVDGDAGGHLPILTLNSATLTVHRADSFYLHTLKGYGEFVKDGPDTVVMTSGHIDFTGRITVNNGLLRFRSAVYGNATNVTVNDGGTLQLEQNGDFPYEFVLNGNGHNGMGALRSQSQANEIPRLHVASDTRIVSLSALVNAELKEDITGTGVLTLDGPGAFDFKAQGISYTNRLIVTNGTTIISGSFPDLHNILVDQGGVLEGLQTQFPSASVVTQNGGVWIQTSNATWTGDGDGTNWSDTANWFPNITPTNTATIPVQTSAQTIVVNIPATLNTLIMHDDPLVNLRIDQNMEIGFLDDANNGPGITLNGATLTLHRADSLYMGKLGGGGTLAKVSDSQVTLNNTDQFTGKITVHDGLFYARGGGSPMQWGAVTVADGATFRIGGPSPHPEGLANIFISGTGHAAIGAALHITEQSRSHSNLTVLADAAVKTDSAMTLIGTLAGPGDLTKLGANTLDLDGIFVYALNAGSGNRIILSAGTLNIVHATLSVSGEENAGGIREFIIIDTSGGGTVIGRFGATNDLKVNWIIDYDGTEDNPDAVVLVKLPTTGSVLEFQ